jgi:predicted transcriptional regulator
MADQEERLTERLMVQLSPRDLRALQAIADDMERPLSWVARRGIRLYISQILEAEETLARGDHIVEGMQSEARERRKAGGNRTDGGPLKP